MKTTAILAAAAAAFLMTSGPVVAAQPEAGPKQTRVKYCYRTVHKLPYRIKVPCRKVMDIKYQPTKPAPQPVPEPKT